MVSAVTSRIMPNRAGAPRVGLAEDVSDEEIALLETFSDQAAIAIANARLLETVERQRSELSRFLSPQVADLITRPDGKQLLAGHVRT